MKNIFNKKTIDRIFELGIFIKSIFGFFEVLAGVVILVTGKLMVNSLILSLTQQEISEDPKDFLANFLIKASKGFYGANHIFAIVYLIFHGAVNIFLAIALLKNKLWVYPWAIAGFGAFIIYQIYKYFGTYSVPLLLLTLFDIFIVLIILLEYRKKHLNKRNAYI